MSNKTPGFTQPGGFVTSGQATAVQSGNTLTVNQTSAQAILNWSSFNVSADGKVVFQQPGATSVALNKIFQASPSAIFGQISANGQIYLINPNGFVFGATSSVNVAGLIASSMGFTQGDAALTTGFVTPAGKSIPSSALTSDGRLYVVDASGNQVPDANGKPQPVQVVVQPGAQITAASGGRVMLAGQQVVNGGTLTAPDGQIVLAAGQSIYLAASNDPQLRGLVVEVSNNPDPSIASQPGNPPSNPGDTAAAQLGTVTNQAGAALSSVRGNVSLLGLAVNQSGRISATTSVSANGSVILQAANGGSSTTPGVTCQGAEQLCANLGGTLKIGASSEIDLLPDLSNNSTAVVAQTQLQSKITLTGEAIDIEGGKIAAPGGTLNAVAAANPDLGLAVHGNPAAQIRLAAGTDIDLSGSDAVVPMSSNLLSIQLRSNELEDDPVQRGGPLLTQTVIVDVRNGRPPIISAGSWQSDVQGVSENILQRTSNGGTASFLSEGDVVVNSGATINVSGGKWTYTGGTTQTTQLIGANGRLYDISTADPSLSYTGVLNPTFTQSFNGFGVQITQATPGLGRYQNGYVQGFSAGTVTFGAPSMALQGTLIGTAVNGLYQRGAANIPADSLFGFMDSGIATGGTLIIGEMKPSVTGNIPDYFSPAVTFANNVSPIVVAEGAPFIAGTLQLPTSYITNGGFQQTEIFGDSTVALPAGLPLNLGVGGSLLVDAAHISINSNIQALGGTIDLHSGDTYLSVIAGVPRTGIDIASGITLDVRGQWTNDSPLAASTAAAPTYQDGGTISLSLTNANAPQTTGGELTIGDNVNFEASGGAWVEANNKIIGGKGGNIKLDASPYQSALQIGNGVSLDAFGVQGALGGSFSLSAPRISVVQGNGTWASAQKLDDLTKPGGVFTVGAGLFSQFGFSSVTLNATAPIVPPTGSTGTPNPNAPSTGPINKDTLTVNTGTTINAQAQSWTLNTGYLMRTTGGTVDAFTHSATLPLGNQNPFSLTLETTAGATDPSTTVAFGNLDIQAGTSITLNANLNSALNLYSVGSLLVDGTLRVQGGTITANITTPQVLTDPGYVPDQHLEIGSQAVLDVSGTTVLTPNAMNLQLGTVLRGGTVTLLANRGDVITDAGSLINIAGSSAVLDVQTVGGSASGSYQLATVGSAGGMLQVQSAESASLLGTLSAAGGASSVGKLAGGTLDVEISAGFRTRIDGASGNPFPSTPLTIELVDNAAGSSPTAPYGNLAVLGVAQLEQSGIDFLKLRADSTIELASNTALSLNGEISLDAPAISVSYGTSAALAAPYVALKDSLIDAGNIALLQPTATTGTGALTVSAQQLVLSGVVALQGVANATLTSSGDVEMEASSGAFLTSQLALNGNLNINASRIYPATQTSFTINDPTGNVTIGQTSASPGNPLSVNGSLTINANNIATSGTLLAPFGSITLHATNLLSLLNGSVTSVSADGATLPYGQTTFGQAQWIYNGGKVTTPVNGVPSRQVRLTAPNVSMASGATVDLSGGGDLSAYEWVPGTGGSVDALGTANATTAGLYAILPSTRGQYAAYDLQEFTGSNVTTGASIYLTGVPGLSAGYYPLLPARYALLPGAYLVQAEPGFTSLTPGRIGTLTDGTAVVAGYTSFGNTGLQTSSGYTGFAVRPGTYGQSLAAYKISNASTYFAAVAANAGTTAILPADAGTLIIEAGSALSAQGSVRSSAGLGGTAATIEISASDLAVTPSTQANAATGVSIGASVLQSWGAGDLILGGELSPDGSLNVTANTVTIGAGAAFSAGQVLAVADQSIEVQSGAVVASTSGLSGMAPKTQPQPTAIKLTHQDPTQTATHSIADNTAALLAVSDSSLPIVTRATTSSSGGAGGSGSGSSPSPATVKIDSGATLSSRGAIALDAPGAVNVAGTLNAPGANVSLATSSIAFVGAGGSSNNTLVINQGLASQLQSVGGLWLTSAGNIDLMAPLTLGIGSAGTPTLGTLDLTASAINNLSGGAVTFGAHTLTLQGNGANAPAPTSNSGSGGALTLVSDNFNISSVAPLAPSTTTAAATTPGTTTTANSYSGNLAINGNTQTTLQVGQALTGQGTNVVGIAGNVTISAAELTAASHSNTALNVPDGTLTIQQNGTAVKPASLATSLGGEISLTAGNIQDSGSIIVPGGQVSLTATRDSSAPAGGALPIPNVTLASGAVVDTSGITVSAGNQTIGAAGGIVKIVSAGDLTLANNASINVSGAGNSPAGFLTLTGGATGTVTLDGSIAGNAAAGATGGSVWIDGGQLAGGLPGLAGKLTSGGFTNQINVRVRTGDLDTAAGTTLTSNQITLTADTGVIDIAGILNAPSAGQRGSIGLFAGGNVTLESTGQLLANGSGITGRGGEIELSTVNGSIGLNGRSVISASGQAGMGSLLLRAPALLSNGVPTGDVAIGNIGSDISGVGIVTVEPVLPTYTYTPQNPGDFTQDFSQIKSDVTNFLANAQSVIPNRLGSSFNSQSGPRFVIEPGVVVDVQGDQTLGGQLDLYAQNLGAPIDLTVRSSGNLTISGGISDGEINGNTVPSATAAVNPLTPYVSSTLRFVAGADLSSANPLATIAGQAANLNLNHNAIVTTATGDIDLVAAGNVNVSAGSSAYTTGDYSTANPGVTSMKLAVGQGGQKVPVNFLINGGNVVVNAGGDVTGQDDIILNGVNSWLGWAFVRGPGAPGTGPAVYGVNLTAFNQNPWSFATFGGGDLSITAGHDVSKVSAAVADSLAVVGLSQTHFASGGMTVNAGHDVTSGQFFVADGVGTLNAGHSFAVNPNNSLGSTFEVDTARVSLWAQDSIAVDGVINPTLLTQDQANGALSILSFSTYGASSAFNAQSSSGDVTLGNTGHVNTMIGGSGSDSDIPYSVLPASLRLVSLTQDIDPSGTLFPSATGQLQLFAGRDITGGNLFMSDALPSDYQTTANVNTQVSGVGNLTNPNTHFSGDLHINDSVPASIVAGRDVIGLDLSVPKATEILAGRDIVNLQYNGVNLNPNDITLVSAGRDFIQAPTFIPSTGLLNTNISGVVSVGGPGQLDMLAGRNIDLGFSLGVITDGKLKNPNLPTVTGASITMIAGLGETMDDAGFLQKIIEPSSSYQQQLVSYVESVNGQTGLSVDQADADFQDFATGQQQAFIDQVFFSELNLSGIEHNKVPGAGYKRGYAAIDALFPGARAAAAGVNGNPSLGNINLTYSQVYTFSGGGITLLAPGGSVNVGLAQPPAGTTAKDPFQLGIVAQGAGNVDIYSEGDVNVNSSRIFTLGGGNIVVWSNGGNIDAGNGAKSSLSLPPPTFTTDKNGNEELDFQAGVAGSGIRTIQEGPGTPLGNVNLIAPVGSVNAGDAGIGAAGNINLAAVVVTGASNINFGGTATGVPPAVANITAAVSGAASAASATANTASAAENLAGKQDLASVVSSAAISWLDVFVSGLGEENCKPEDQQCLDREKKEKNDKQ